MQILGNVVQFVPVNVVDDLTRLGPSDSAMLPLLSVGTFRSVGAQALGVKRLSMCAVRPLSLGVCRDGRSNHGRRRNLVAAPHVFAGRKARDLLCIGVKRVAVPMPHLVVPHAQVARCDRAVAVEALSAHNLAAPAVLWASVSLHAFVVHQAQPVRCVLSTTTFDGANLHGNPYLWIANCMYYKALGNSWAVPVVRWIGERIAGWDLHDAAGALLASIKDKT